MPSIEAGKKLHEYGEAAEEEKAEEKGGHSESADRHSRIIQICEAALLAIVTLTAAWAGYSAAKWSTASRVDNESAAKFQTGNQDALTSDDYVRITVLLAVVLFLVGIGSSFKLKGVRYALIACGSVLLILSVVLILQQPGPPS